MNAQELPPLPPIYKDTPKQIVSAKIVAEFPVNTFLENIAVDERGDLFVASYEDGKIHRIKPESGERSEFARVNGKIAGLVLNRRGELLASGWVDGKTPAVFRINRKGKSETLVTLAGGIFPNGIAHLKDDRYLVADSHRGAIYEVDERGRRAEIWLENEILTRRNPQDVPAVNGLKVVGSNLYASNMGRMYLLRIPLVGDARPGTPEILLRDVFLDDFAFDRRGNLYGATHMYDSVIKITPEGTISIIAGAEQGVVGSTAVAFGRTDKDRTSLYVVTDGGIVKPPPGGVQTGKVVRLEIGGTNDVSPTATAAEKVNSESAALKTGRQAFAAWELGENTGDYSRFRTLLAANFRLFTHPSVERGFHVDSAARERMLRLVESREKAPNKLKFSNVVWAENGGWAIFMFDSAGKLAGDVSYKGYNAIAFLVENGKIVGFREYFGDVDPNWFK